MNFEKREVTRPAGPEEKGDITKRLLDVLNDIDSVKAEAKDVAKTYKEQLDGLEYRKLGLRLNLENGTVTQEIDVHPVANLSMGMMEYFNRDGVEVIELRHDMSDKQREQEALNKQLGLFNDPQESANKLQAGMQEKFGSDVTVSINGFQASDIAGFKGSKDDTIGVVTIDSNPFAEVNDTDLPLASADSDKQFISEVAPEGDSIELISSQLHEHPVSDANLQQTEPTVAATDVNVRVPARKNGKFAKREPVTS